MGSIEGYITVFESSDGGTGDPVKTFWQFFVHVLGGGTQQVTTENARLAETMRLAVETTSNVRVTYDDATKVMSQARTDDPLYDQAIHQVPAQRVVHRCVIARQTEIVLDQLKLCLETAGTSLENVLKCEVHCTDALYFKIITEIYARYFPVDPPARTFLCVSPWHGPFDVEMSCIATL
jgi:2-iminobutanoate/2-iminopropanoate deaminase